MNRISVSMTKFQDFESVNLLTIKSLIFLFDPGDPTEHERNHALEI